MLRRLIPLLLLLLAVPGLRAQAHPEQEAVLQALQAGCEAYRTSDVDAIADFLDAGYTLTNSRGEVTTREQDLAEVRSGAVRYEEFRNHDMQARFYGDTAVVNGKTTVKGTAGGEAFSATFQFTDTLIKQEGRWKLAASHASRLQP